MYTVFRLILYFCFFLSGVAGLVYEVLWAKYLALIFGATAYAHTLVLATFMGGLALGGFIIGRLSDRVRNKIALYGALEIAIAAFAFTTPFLLKYSKEFYMSIAANGTTPFAVVLAAKFLIGTLILLPPTILMGGTLPVIGKAIVRTMEERGNAVARLYYLNSFGAVAGTVLAGFFLVACFGLDSSIYIGVVINFIAGLTALMISRFYKPYEENNKGNNIIPAAVYVFPRKVIIISLAAIFMSGFAAMLYEVVWIRLLSMVLGSSTYSFSIMLAAFISGITIGSYIISKRMPSDEKAFYYFGMVELGIGVSLLACLPFYEELPYIFLSMSWFLKANVYGFAVGQAIKFLFCFIIMLPSTIFLGMSVPIVCKIVSSNYGSLGRKVGGVLAFNTSGNILGALLGGLVIMPLMGLKNSIQLGILVNILLGALVLLNDGNRRLKFKRLAIIISLSVFCIYCIVFPDWNKMKFLAQIFRTKVKPEAYRLFLTLPRDNRILYYEDGVNDTVTVKQTAGKITLMINGKADASTGADMSTQILVGQIPMILKGGALDVLIVGLGSGVTAGSVLRHPVKGLDVVEISEAVVNGSRYFRGYNYDALNDRRLRLFIEDAKTFLGTRDKKYDVIISEPSNPWMSGVAGLFSIEYFTDCAKRLKDDGVIVHWVQAYETDDEIFKIVLSTFRSVFPNVSIWSSSVRDLILVGTKNGFKPDLTLSSRIFEKESVRGDLRRIGINTFYTFLNMQLLSEESAQRIFIEKFPVNSDYFPVLEYKAPYALFKESDISAFIGNFDERMSSEKVNGLLTKIYVQNNPVTNQEVEDLKDFLRKSRAPYQKSYLETISSDE